MRRLLEVLTGAATWLLITAPAWAAVLIPRHWVYLFALFSLYWVYRSGCLAVAALLAYRRLRAAQHRDWLAACQRLDGWREVHHLLVFPAYREPVELLEESLSHVARQDFPSDQVSVLLALEGRDPEAPHTASRLRARFESAFANFWITIHPQRPGEPSGKAANLAYALPRARNLLLASGRTDADRVLVTVCDADSRLHPGYLSALTCAYLAEPDGRACLYQPALLFHANLERIPLFVRAIDSLYSVIQLARLAMGRKLLTQSTYSLALSACHAIGYWCPQVVPEDSHTFFKMLFHWGEKTRVQPIYLPVLADAAEGETWWRTLVSHYRQARRWSWGVSDVPYVLFHAATSRHRPLLALLGRAVHYLKEHLLWPSHWFLLAGGFNLVPLVAPTQVHRGGLADVMLLSSLALSACAPFVLVLIWIDQRLRAERIGRLPWWRRGLEALSWALLPVLSLGLMVLPAVEAHTRLLLGLRLGYDATQKWAGGQGGRGRLATASSLADQRAA